MRLTLTIEGINRQSELFVVQIEGKADNELVLLSFVLPENINPDGYQIVEVNVLEGTLSYPDVNLSVIEGLSYLEGFVLNGSMCFLAMK